MFGRAKNTYSHFRFEHLKMLSNYCHILTSVFFANKANFIDGLI